MHEIFVADDAVYAYYLNVRTMRYQKIPCGRYLPVAGVALLAGARSRRLVEIGLRRPEGQLSVEVGNLLHAEAQEACHAWIEVAARAGNPRMG